MNDLNPSEITETVLEMESKVIGSWVETDEDIELNEKFWSELRAWPNFSKYHGWIHPEARLGTHYLRRSKDWLFDQVILSHRKVLTVIRIRTLVKDIAVRSIFDPHPAGVVPTVSGSA